ncbi:outer membrane beta-barrel protein [Halomonas vilamensis]|uniref:Outer membrane beta-barrel protein n=1 Tax=Vreelandella vilamensis TaxID=531309 RepID=A0ABU1H5I1_9GAMM|nr:outer membrane beta-barrel protein [Halomonas vilamensis]MDR5898917.1 outer membrane beta-barrel protein [Halomonas vilamensis]
MKKVILGLCSISVVVFNISVSSADAGPYIGGFIGKAEVDGLSDIGESDISVDDSDTVYKFLVGHRVNDHFAIEAFYADHGEYSVRSSIFSVNLDASSVGVAALAIAPISPSFELHGKLGVHAWDSDWEVYDLNYGGSDSGTDFMFGVGMSYREGPVSLRIDLERYDYDTDVDTASLGLIYHF